MERSLFVIIFIGLAAFDLVFARLSLNKIGIRGKFLAACLYCSCFVTVTYMLSILATSYTAMSAMSSLYFCGTDMTVTALVLYTAMFVESEERFVFRAGYLLIFGVIAVDMLIMLSNPFFEIAMTYNPTGGDLVKWAYDQKFLHHIHMFINYTAVFISFAMLVVKMASVSSIYRGRYINMIAGLVLVVAINVVFVYLPFSVIDWSIPVYSLLAIFYYVNDYNYSRKHMISSAQGLILDDMGHPVVLFDNEGRFTICNKDAAELIPKEKQTDTYYIDDFLKDCGMDEGLAESRKDTSFRWTHDGSKVFRCDFHPLIDKRAGLIGRLFVFTDNSLEFDITSGFPTMAAAVRYFEDECTENLDHAAVMAFDINQLSRINSEYGNHIGDQAIQLLAKLIREECPNNSYFVRMEDANLIAVGFDMGIFEARNITGNIIRKFTEPGNFVCPLQAQSSICMTGPRMILPDAVEIARKSLKAGKMLDSGSAHASLLASLAQAQIEGDSETEAHVRRTREMGDLLGRRMGLGDRDLNDLSLLCLLHDIGKVGIPLEILNKPGKLTKEEQTVMKSHVEKGYRIAMASDELKHIADYIRHHHECWDGSGYPDGLRKNSIPILSRIVAVVDTYDAMTNDRPYRKALPGTVAAAELKKFAGTQFDPNVVSEFLDMLEEMFGIRPEAVKKGTGPDSRPVGISTSAREEASHEDNIYPVDYAMYKLDKNSRIISINDKFTELTGYSVEDLDKYNLNQRDLIFKEDMDGYFDAVFKRIKADHMAYLEHRIRRKDGSAVNVLCYGREFYDPVSREMRNMIICTDLSETWSAKTQLVRMKDIEARNISRLEDIIRKDPKTGLLTREAYQADVDEILIRGGRRALMLLIDIDNLKQYNISMGRSRGDELIERVAESLSDSVAESGLVSRLGGDEFSAVIWFDDDAKESEMQEKAREVYSRIVRNISTGEGENSITMEVSCSSDSVNSFHKLFESADTVTFDLEDNNRKGV